MNNIAQMSCNPAVGGIAKGQIVREIDALGGMMGIVTDETMIQSKMLNRDLPMGCFVIYYLIMIIQLVFVGFMKLDLTYMDLIIL